MRKIELSEEHIVVILEALRTRLSMGQFELSELRRITNNIVTDATVYTAKQVRDVAETLQCLEAQIQ